MERNIMYIIFYWDAYGNPHQTKRMTKEQADIVAAAMSGDQEPYLVYVR
jgi:hypothetical protein